MAARSSDGTQSTGNTRMPVRKATSSTADRLVGSTIASVSAPADLRLALGRLAVAVVAVRGMGISGVTVAVRGRGDGGAGGRLFPGPLPVDGALETHSRETRLQGGNQSDQASHRIAISVTCVTPRPAARVLPDLAGNEVPGQELTEAARALATRGL